MKKYIAISALLHTLLLAFVLSQTQPPQIDKKEKTVVIEVLKVEEPKKEKPKPIEKSKPVEKPKPTPKEKPKIEQKVVTQKAAVAEPKFEVAEPTPQKETPKDEAQVVLPPPPKPTISSEEIQNAKDVYLAKLRKAIEEKKTYPKNAKRLKQSGVVHVRFTLLRDGTIKNAQVAQTSSFEILDNATLNLLKEIAKTEPFPKELSDDTMVIVLPIEYSLLD